ncbi:MAG: Re/Si-specific NAD(P)(+) transhydrogenase subunit alpha [Planctomycetota bacterium]|jgi:NAD(P) transhydrogenase subunit alpha|nr:Re/Si-specific NAD(P)(+) transhydrogenase subunit alpha [Planctomycetota bacterium]MDP6761934.1 Re/Si-specific NAD(P)(+) transhydrogenase subunit alpha [Planctomycetota bacterium]MDP6989321.1 Re/Si-specific NAD(P)(+) transhydrogenase subunit alpha [Planctomycetota bacterium]
MQVFIPTESAPGETRVAATPETVARLVKRGVAVTVQAGAGARSYFVDEAFRKAGAEIADAAAPAGAALVARVQPPSAEEIEVLAEGSVLVGHVFATADRSRAERLASRGVTTFAMELVPRTSRAQTMDALSSQATVAGYKAVILAAESLDKLCPLLMTAAGTVKPARAVVFGAGVAGLQAIATARRLGCVVEATDIRAAAKEQVESLGARFIDVPGAEDMEDEGGYAREADEEFLARQREEVARRVEGADIVITTAQIPGRPAPRLVSEELVRSMRPGSVIVDLAVESGGNCELSVPGETVECHGVRIVGQRNLPASVPRDASSLYAKNVLALLGLMYDGEGAFALDLEDDVLAGCLLTHGGAIVHPATLEQLGMAQA